MISAPGLGSGLDVSSIVSQLVQVEGEPIANRLNLREAGIEVDIDNVSGIAHNKIIIIDKQKVITGSFNFTTSADIRNTENVIIVNNSELAKKYIQNWFARKEHSEISRLKRAS